MSFSFGSAQTYFRTENHIRGAVWAQFGEPHQKAALAQAKRILSRALNADIEDETVDTGDYTYRPDYAVFEQALWLLENGVIANGAQSAPGFVASDPEKPDNARDSQQALIAPEAMRWLSGTGPRVVMARG